MRKKPAKKYLFLTIHLNVRKAGIHAEINADEFHWNEFSDW